MCLIKEKPNSKEELDAGEASGVKDKQDDRDDECRKTRTTLFFRVLFIVLEHAL